MELKIYNPKENGFLQEIDWNYEELKAEIAKKANDYMNLVYSNDQIKEAKEDRANLRKFVKTLEDKRKEIKRQVMIPYSDFEKKEKELVTIVNQAVSNIDTQVKGYEEGLRQAKLEKVKEIYTEAIGDLDRTIPFEKVFKDSWLNASTTLKSITKEIEEIRYKVDSDLKVINTDASPYVFEMKEEYLKNFDLTAAMLKKQQLEETAKKKALFEEQRKQKEEERQQKLKEEAKRVESAGKEPKPVKQDVVPAEQQAKEKTLSITFKVTAKESQFSLVNSLLSQFKNACESFEILGQEEL